MDLIEYEKVKEMTYLEYCDYLQNKYGIAICDYMTKSWNKNNKVTRTKEGLLAHHKYEDHAILLADKDHAMRHPFEWQKAENIIYCDYLEHLFLHILICESPSDQKVKNEAVGIGGIINYLVPELNDFYSGWEPRLEWKKICYERVRGKKELYMVLLRRFKMNCSNYPFYTNTCLLTSYNEKYEDWNRERNNAIFEEIKAL